jgi:Ca2+-binding EF-hand superfamily protein
MTSFRAAFAVACLLTSACQPGSGAKMELQSSPERLEYIEQFKKIDTAGKGLITLDQATSYYSGLFAELDKNGNGFLDSNELQLLIPIMQAKTGSELLSKLDRNGDGKVSQSEFLVIVNWLFQLARSSNEMTLEDAQKGAPQMVARPKQKDPSDTPPGGGRR